MPPRKDKKYWEERSKKAERSAKTSQMKLKAYKEGFKDGLEAGIKSKQS